MKISRYSLHPKNTINDVLLSYETLFIELNMHTSDTRKT